jgi:hypothetical protein
MDSENSLYGLWIKARKRKGLVLLIVFLSICVLVFLVGLWPFSFFPANGVSWLNGENGIVFANRGILFGPDISSSTWLKSIVDNGFSMSLEIWLQSDEEPNGIANILCFSDSRLPEILTLAQWKSHMLIRGRLSESSNRIAFREIGLSDALRLGQKRFLTIVLGRGGTVLYLDGQLAEIHPEFTLTGHKDALTLSRLVFGNDASGKHPWTGKVFGLAVYDQELTSQKVFDHFQLWKSDDMRSLSKGEGIVALYPMDEQHGVWIHNRLSNRDHLWIPEDFLVLRRQVLISSWEGFSLAGFPLNDMTINVGGFMPFGFFLLAYLVSIHTNTGRRSVWFSFIVICSGGCLSLAVELIQIYLPDRVSSLTDLTWNTLGTGFGVTLFHLWHLSRGKLSPKTS